MSFLRSVSIFFSSRVVSALSILAIGVITARWLSPEGRGYYALFFTITGLMANALNLGISQANTYLLNREKQGVGVLFGNTSFFVTGVAGLSAITIGVLYGVFGLTMAGIPGLETWFLLWLAVAVLLTETAFGGLVYGSHFYALQSKSLIVQAMLLLAATSLILLFQEKLLAALWLRVCAMTIFVIWYLYVFWKKIGPVRFERSKSVFVMQVKFGSRSWLQNLIGLLNYRGYLLLLGGLSGARSVGLFSVALLLVEAVRFIPDTVATLLLPRLVSMKAGRDSGLYAARTCRNVLFMAAVIAGILFILAPWLVPVVFGGEYQDAAVIAQILLAGSVGGTVYQVLTRYFTSEARQVYSIITALIVLLVGGGLALVLIPPYGGVGAAWAYAVSSFTAAVFMLYFFNKNSGVPMLHALFPNREDWMYYKILIMKPFER